VLADRCSHMSGAVRRGLADGCLTCPGTAACSGSPTGRWHKDPLPRAATFGVRGADGAIRSASPALAGIGDGARCGIGLGVIDAGSGWPG
jgi:hypothetical protein